MLVTPQWSLTPQKRHVYRFRMREKRVGSGKVAQALVYLCLKSRQELISLQRAHLMSMHVCLPAQYVRTRQAGISSANTCQIQKTL